MLERLTSGISLLTTLASGASQRHLGLIAAGVGFYGLMAIFPAITSFVTLWGFFADPQVVEQQTLAFESLMPDEAYLMLKAQVHALASGPKTVLGWASVLSILAALWATRAGVGAMIGGLNAAYDTRRRGGLRSLGMALLLTFLLIGVALVALNAVIVAPVVVSFLNLGTFTGLVLQIIRWIVSVGVVLLGIGLCYRLGPNRPDARSKLISPGSVTAVVLWAFLSWAFSTYLENFGRYNEIYGSLGAVVALLMWLYLSAFIVLLGGLLNAELERRAKVRNMLADAGSTARSDASADDSDPIV